MLMDRISLNVVACHACLRGTAGVACRADGKPILEHAQAGQCPLGKFRVLPLVGDLVEQLAKKIGADRLAAWWEKKTGRPCGCAERKEKLNHATRALARLARWMGIPVSAAPAAEPARKAVEGPSSHN